MLRIVRMDQYSLMNTKLKVQEPKLIPYDEYDFFYNIVLYTTICNCIVVIFCLLTIVYLSVNIRKIKRCVAGSHDPSNFRNRTL